MNYIGIDIGDGESCVCYLPAGSDIEPRPLTLTGKQSFISAVAENERGETLIGMDAVHAPQVRRFSVRFKSRYLQSSPETLQDMRRFLEGTYQILKRQGSLQSGDQVMFGCPAGWNSQARSDYLSMIQSVGFSNARLISESRAAFLYAKHARTIQLNPELIEQSALVIDIGSSTLDFAYVLDGRESSVGTFGDVYLGGGAIEEALLEAAVKASSQQREIQQIFEEAPEWRNFCLLAARRVKEDYFSQEAEGKQNISCCEMPVILYDKPLSLRIHANETLIWRVVNLSIQALNGVSFYQMLKDALAYAERQMLDRPPRVVLMTGGASRMGFFQRLCADQFSKAELVLCPEPEFSIARGLAYAAKVDEEIFAFNAAVEEYLKQDHISRTVNECCAGLVPALAEQMADALYPQMEAEVEAWKNGSYDTIDSLRQALPKALIQSLENPELERSLAGIVQQQMRLACQRLQPALDEICKRYHVSRGLMQLENPTSWHTASLEMKMDFQQGVDALVNPLQVTLTAMVAAIMLLIPGGELIDLLVIAITALGSQLAKDQLAKQVSRMNLPVWLRRRIPSSKLVNESLRQQINDSLKKQIQSQPELMTNLTSGIEQSISAYISRMAQKTEIYIREVG